MNIRGPAFMRLRVLIAIQNMSYTFDTRVRNIARTLEREGCRVWVVCPRYPGDPFRRVEGDVRVYFFPMPMFPRGFLWHVIEYGYSFAALGLATLAAFITTRFHVIHVCNPPDIFAPFGALYRLLGRKFIFDMHDLCPELWQARYGRWKAIHRVLLMLEHATVKSASHVLATSETARERVCERTRLPKDRITLVRNGPRLEYFPPPPTGPDATEAIEIGYIGDMNPQDNVEILLQAALYLRETLHRCDLRFVLIGDGSSYASLRRQAEGFGLSDCVEFTGRLPPREAMQRLARCAFCVLPDLKNAFNDACVMVKSLEYMALGKALVAFDLTETQRVCLDAALYARGNDYRSFARQMMKLVKDAPLRNQLGSRGRTRIEQSLAWSFSEERLLSVYRQLFYRQPTPVPHPARHE